MEKSWRRDIMVLGAVAGSIALMWSDLKLSDLMLSRKEPG
jgi:hypothetical protein